MKSFIIVTILTSMAITATAQEGSLRHVVSFKFKEDATKEQVEALVSAFANLKNEIKEVQSFEWGINNSPEGFNMELTHCFILTFQNEADRDAYLPHPAHADFIENHGKIVENVFVIDYDVRTDSEDW